MRTSSMTKQSLDRRALGIALSRIADATVWQSLAAQSSPAARARRIAITGAPGAGKSTLVGLVAMQRLAGQRIGVLAIDPSSPRSGGAILGDRVRMDELAGSAELYIRSLGSRSATDGLTDNLPDMLDVMDTFDFDEVIVETVGVGQAEYAVRSQVDTVVLVLLPDSGDIVQAMKAGIMEMADIFVVNKSDLSGANRMATDIKRIAALTKPTPGGWSPPVVLTAAQSPQSIADLSAAIDRHRTWLNTSERAADLTLERARYRLKRAMERMVGSRLAAMGQHAFDRPMAEQVRTLLLSLVQPDDLAGTRPVLLR